MNLSAAENRVFLNVYLLALGAACILIVHWSATVHAPLNMFSQTGA